MDGRSVLPRWGGVGWELVAKAISVLHQVYKIEPNSLRAADTHEEGSCMSQMTSCGQMMRADDPITHCTSFHKPADTSSNAEKTEGNKLLLTKPPIYLTSFMTLCRAEGLSENTGVLKSKYHRLYYANVPTLTPPSHQIAQRYHSDLSPYRTNDEDERINCQNDQGERESLGGKQ
ncbi:hypothetical protein BaRGS_00002643 [Batillaria attramentaria]|uniref:Uncharacterized protein n=1 Tax=Batillaria attramentaria TaxID=370345 RepID=A0ABD0M3L4_9CAEN